MLALGQIVLYRRPSRQEEADNPWIPAVVNQIVGEDLYNLFVLHFDGQFFARNVREQDILLAELLADSVLARILNRMAELEARVTELEIAATSSPNSVPAPLVDVKSLSITIPPPLDPTSSKKDKAKA